MRMVKINLESNVNLPLPLLKGLCVYSLKCAVSQTETTSCFLDCLLCFKNAILDSEYQHLCNFAH